MSDKPATPTVPHGAERRRMPEYISWNRMRARCLNVREHNYDKYGGRGITVCERWVSFENFLSDMGLKPTRLHSLDRIDNNGNYEPSNCRWSTPRQQQNNTGRRKSASGIQGIYKRRNKWIASIHAGGKSKHIGMFGSPEEAAEAYRQEKIKIIQEADEEAEKMILAAKPAAPEGTGGR